ncbi:hypothetical protein ABPG74_001484 [Tetrahymena malaccensis]
METFCLQCPKHPQKKIKFLVNTISEGQQVLICSQCVSDSLIKKGEYILISQVIQQGQNNMIQKWPPLQDDQIINKLVDLEQKKSINNHANKIVSFVDSLKKEIIQKIDAIAKSVLIKINDQNEQILQKYQEISQIQQLKEILMNQNQESYENQEQKCKLLIQKLEEQKEKNSIIFQDLYNKTSQVENEINLENNNVIQQQILLLLDDLNFFEEKQNQENEQIVKIEIPQFENKKQNSSHQQKTTSDTIYQLISNKSNYCSDKFLQEIRLILKRIEPLLSQIKTQDIYQTNKWPIQFYNLKKENFDKVESYIKHISKINQRKKKYIKFVEQSQEIQQINKILNNKWNFLTESFKNNFIEYLIETYPFLGSLDVNYIVEQSENISNIQNLNDAEINELLLLIKKRVEFRQQQNFDSSNSKHFIDQFQNELSAYIPQDRIQNLILKFPIFDCINVYKKIDILKKIQLFQDSNDYGIIIKKLPNNQITVQSNFLRDNLKNCLFQYNFQNNIAYIIRIKFKRSQQSKAFKVGFLYESKYLKYLSYQSKLECQFVLINNQIHQQLQNKSTEPFTDGNQIEIRIHIDQLQLEVLDYPNYANKIIMTNQHFKDQLQTIHNCKLFLSIPYNIQLAVTEAFENREQE